MGKKILALLGTLSILFCMGTLFASAEYIDQGTRTFSNILCYDGATRTLYQKYSETLKDSFYGTTLSGFCSLEKNSLDSPTYKEYFAQTINGGGTVTPRTVTIKVSISADSISHNQSNQNETGVVVMGYRYSGKTWTAFVTSEAIYTTSTVEYYRVNNW